jgi:uncharacterized protein YbcC (UPF0753/DUF2309 family)
MPFPGLRSFVNFADWSATLPSMERHRLIEYLAARLIVP